MNFQGYMFFVQKEKGKNKISHARKKEALKAFMLIEALTVIFIFSVIMTTFYAAFATGTRAIIDVKNRLGAISLANEKMEIVRNLNYANVGISGGIPNGNILADENVSANGKNYHVKTFIQYVDDSLDGIYPTDTIPNDYKRVRISVAWNNGISSVGNVYVVSRFVPYGLESSVGGGVLAINIVDGTGAGVSRADVHVVNSTVSPAVNFSAQTSDLGNLMFPGALPSTQNYQLTVSKSGYEAVATLPPYPITASYYPTDVHASVTTGALNVKTVVINRLANLHIFTADGAGNKISDVPCDFSLTGGRIIGTTPDMTHDPIYSIQNQSSSVPTGGEKDFDIISPGQYALTVSVPSGYALVGIDPATPFSLEPDTTLEAKIKLAEMNSSALLLTVEDATSKVISGAQVELRDALGYNVVQLTGVDGKVFFLNGTDPLSPGTYDLKVIAVGYQENNSQVVIVETELKTATITMIP